MFRGKKGASSLLLWVVLCLVLVACGSMAATATSQAGGAYREGELLVKFRKGVPKKTVLAIVAGKGGAVVGHLQSIDVFQLRLRAGQSVPDAVKEYGELAEVQYAEPNYLVRKNGANPMSR